MKPVLMSILGLLTLVAGILLGSAAGASAGAVHRSSEPSESSLGDQAYSREDWEAAIHHYRRARRADPNDVVIYDRLIEAEREYRQDASLNRLYTPHFVVAFPKEVSHRAANQVADRLEAIAQRIEAALAYLPERPLSVVLYSRPQFHAATFSPPWTKAVFDGKIRLLIEGRPGLVSDEVLTHEYVHAAVHRLSTGHVPAWLSEGLALFFDGGRQRWQRSPGSGRRDYLPLTTTHADLTSLSPADARAAYRHSYDITAALLRQFGLTRVRLLLERLSRTPNFPVAFKDVMGERFIEFQQQWAAEQERKGF